MADPVGELKAAIDRAIQMKIQATNAREARDLPLQTFAPGNPLGAGVAVESSQVFATGWDGTDTVLPFTWGQSIWGESDVWTTS